MTTCRINRNLRVLLHLSLVHGRKGRHGGRKLTPSLLHMGRRERHGGRKLTMKGKLASDPKTTRNCLCEIVQRSSSIWGFLLIPIRRETWWSCPNHGNLPSKFQYIFKTIDFSHGWWWTCKGRAYEGGKADIIIEFESFYRTLAEYDKIIASLPVFQKGPASSVIFATVGRGILHYWSIVGYCRFVYVVCVELACRSGNGF